MQFISLCGQIDCAEVNSLLLGTFVLHPAVEVTVNRIVFFAKKGKLIINFQSNSEMSLLKLVIMINVDVLQKQIK